jgi:hypothetical protein
LKVARSKVYGINMETTVVYGQQKQETKYLITNVSTVTTAIPINYYYYYYWNIISYINARSEMVNFSNRHAKTKNIHST